jgi:fibronectin type 3 domain-containing protein
MKPQNRQELSLNLFALLLFVFAPATWAATITSTASGGLWSATTTWSGGAVPGTADDVVIATTSGNQVQLNSSSTVLSVTINSGATLGLNDGATSRTLTLTGNLVNNGTITLGTGATTSPTAKIVFSGAGRTWTGSGDLSGVKCGLQVNSSGSLDISGLTTPVKLRSGTGGQPWTINGTLITGTQVINNNANISMTVIFGANSSLVTANPNGIIAATGTFGNTFQSSQFTWTAGASVTFNGSAGQVTTGLPATIANLTINNSGAGVTLSQTTTVSGILTLTSGTLTTTAANLLTIGSAGSISGGSASSYVNGPLAQAYSGAVSKDFPIGVSPNLRKVTLNITSASGTPTITITPNEPSTFSCTAPGGYAVSALRDWTVASSVAGPQTADLTVDATGYATASTLIQCVGGTASLLPTTGTWPTLSAAGISVGTSQEYAFGEACASSPPTLTSVSDGGVACNPVTVAWGTDGTSTYKIYRKTGAGSYSQLASGLTASPYNDPTAAGNTTYTYAVSAVAPCGAQSDKAEFSPYTTTAGKPAAPAQPTITSNCGSLTVNWNSVSGATSYNVYRKLSGGSYGAPIATGETGTSYLDAGASDSTKTYVYAVAGADACEGFLSPDSAGVSPFFAPSISSSPAAEVTNVLGSSSVLAVTATGSGLSYQWQVDKGNGFANAVEITDGTGTTTANFTTVLTTAGMSGYRYQCVVSGACAPSQTSIPTTLHPAVFVRSAASGSFAAAASFETSVDGSTGWIAANGAPNSNSVTTIRSGHSLTNSNPNERQVRSLTIDAGGQLLNGNGSTVRSLAIFGSLTNNGSFLAGGSATHHLYFRGSGSWVGSGELNNGVGGIDITVDSGVTLDASGLTTPIKMHATQTTPFMVNGTLNAGNLTINGNGNAANIFTLASGATLVSANPNGLTGAAATLNFLTAPSLSAAGNYILNSSSAQATTGLPGTVNNLTIANTGGAVSLSGNAAVNGTLTVNPGANLDLNSQTVTTPNAPVLNGALTMEVNKTGANTFTGSKLTQTAGTLSYGGTLTVTATGNALAGGDVIPLFSSTSANYGGGFSTVTGPAKPAGLTRDASQLTGGTGGNITFACDGSLVAHTATDTAICPGGSYSLNGSATDGGGSYTYSWVSAPAGFTSTAANPSVSPTATTTYTLTVTDGNGCTASAAVTVAVNVCTASVTISEILGTSLSYSGGVGTKFVLFSSRSVDAPMSAWTRVETNSATPGTFTIPAVGSSAQLFYRIQSE